MPAGELHCPEQEEKPRGSFLFYTDALAETLSYRTSFKSVVPNLGSGLRGGPLDVNLQSAASFPDFKAGTPR